MAVIPAFNEALALHAVVAEVLARGYSVVVVDDGSTDATAAVARKAGAKVIRHCVNLGQGAALQTGLDYALRQGAPFIVTVDADGQHGAADLDRLMEPLVSGRAEFTLGSRFLGSFEGAPASRRLLLRLATLFTRLDSGLAVTDAHNGLRGMTRRAAQRINLRQNRMAHASEILRQIAASGLPWTEVPVTVAYTAYSRAKGQRGSDSLRILADLIAQGLSR